MRAFCNGAHVFYLSTIVDMRVLLGYNGCMKSSAPKQNSPQESYIRCLHCKTIIKGNPGVCPNCGVVLSDGTFEEVIKQTTLVQNKKETLRTENNRKILSIIAVILSIVSGLAVCWIPFIGAGLSIIPLVFSSIVSYKTYNTSRFKLAAFALLIAIGSLVMGVVMMFAVGTEFIDKFWR